MKKAFYILFALLLGVVSCNKAELETPEVKKDVEPTGLVAITMKADIPLLQAHTRALGDFSDTPSIKDIHVAVFGTSGYPQAYTIAEPVDASGNALSDYATENGRTYYFKVLLPVYEGEAHVHIIANGPASIPFVDQDEDSIMATMRSESPVGAYWARIVMPDGILTQLDDNGIMQTDDEGNYIPSDGTAHLFEDLVLVRNFAEIKLLIDDTVTNLDYISWTLVNTPVSGSVAPMADGFVDDFKDYTYNASTGRMVNGSKVYEGFLFDDYDEENKPVDFTQPTDATITTPVSGLNFMYERPHPGSEKATCLLVKGKYTAEGLSQDDYYTYYRIDLMDEAVGGYFPIYRNYRYQVRIHKVGNRGARTIAEAMNRDSGGNVSLSTEAQKLTDISDGTSRLYVEYVEKSFTSGGKKSLWVYYVPDVSTGVVDNTKITWSIKEQGTALVEGATVTKSATSSDTGAYVLEFELNDQSETTDLVSKLQIKASNGVEGDDNSTLYRDITLRVLKKMDMSLSLVPKKVEGQGSSTLLNITLPDNLPSSMFPMEFYIEDINHTLYSTGSDGTNDIIVPVKTDNSIVDGKTNSFYFIRTVNESEYKTNHTISTQFKTNKDASATTIYVANEYFKTQSINLLNDGMYVNPVKATVPFNTTSVKVEVEFAEPDGKSWTVSGGAGVTIANIVNSNGEAFEGTPTGNGTFEMRFLANNSTTASVTRTATVTYNGTPHTVTITQSPLEFSVTTDTPTIIASATKATVTIHAEEGKSWTASVSGPNGTNPTLSANSGTGTTTLTVTLPANNTTQRQFTVTATMTDPAATASTTITQLRAPNTYSDFAYNGFGGNFSGSASATSSDGYITVNLANCERSNSSGYIQTAYNGQNGVITITPISGMKITTVVVTYSSNYYVDSNPTVSTGSKTVSGNTVTWTVNSSSAVTYTNNGNITNYRHRMTNIRVNYEPI